MKKEHIIFSIAIYINAKLEFADDEIRPLLYGGSGFFSAFPDVDWVILVSEIENCIFSFQCWSKPKYTKTDMFPSKLIIDMRQKTIIPIGK